VKRREFIGLLGGAAAAWSLAARAQQRATPAVGVLSGGSSDFPAFTRGLAESGYQNGRNVRIEFVSGRYDQLPTLAQELVGRQVAVIAPMGIDAAQAAKQATSSIPIVFVFGVDPIKFGFVRSLSRPGGNITGMSLYTSELHAKRVELLDEFVPAGAPVGMIVNLKMPDTEPQVQSADAATRAKGHPLVVVRASSEDELNTAFGALAEHHVAGVLAVSDAFLNSRRDQIYNARRAVLGPHDVSVSRRCRRWWSA
jgi:putative ABC transport system substrate-binding protein